MTPKEQELGCDIGTLFVLGVFPMSQRRAIGSIASKTKKKTPKPSYGPPLWGGSFPLISLGFWGPFGGQNDPQKGSKTRFLADFRDFQGGTPGNREKPQKRARFSGTFFQNFRKFCQKGSKNRSGDRFLGPTPHFEFHCQVLCVPFAILQDF